MNVIRAVIIVMLVGAITYYGLNLVPMAPVFKQIVMFVAVIGIVLYLLCEFEIFCLGSRKKPE